MKFDKHGFFIKCIKTFYNFDNYHPEKLIKIIDGHKKSKDNYYRELAESFKRSLCYFIVSNYMSPIFFEELTNVSFDTQEEIDEIFLNLWTRLYKEEDVKNFSESIGLNPTTPSSS